MKDHLVALIEAVRRSQDELINFIEEDKADMSDSRRTLAELCNILGDDIVIDAMISLSEASEVDLAPLRAVADAAAVKH